FRLLPVLAEIVSEAPRVRCCCSQPVSAPQPVRWQSNRARVAVVKVCSMLILHQLVDIGLVYAVAFPTLGSWFSAPDEYTDGQADDKQGEPAQGDRQPRNCWSWNDGRFVYDFFGRWWLGCISHCSAMGVTISEIEVQRQRVKIH